MSGTTTRGYPFPTNSDDVDVPGDMALLAAAVDTDVAAVVAGGKAVQNYQSTDELAITSTTYIQGSNTCGVAFVAPPSGSVTIFWSGRIQNNTAGRTFALTVEVKAGNTIGSGSVISAGADNNAIECGQAVSDRVQACMMRDVRGLTPGANYNVVTQHRVINGAGNGDVYERGVKVIPDLSV